MSSPDPVLHLVVGPNGAGKTTLYDEVIAPATGLEFVNADRLVAERWPGDEAAHVYEAAAAAEKERDRRIAARTSFAAETVFSHPSKVDLVRRAKDAGYLVTLHIVMVPEDGAVARVASRVEAGGHPVPEDKIRERWQRLWPLVAEAAALADETRVYDNSSAVTPLRLVATYSRGRLVAEYRWPRWAPPELRHIGH